MPFEYPSRSNSAAPAPNLCARCGAVNPFVNATCAQCGAALSRPQTPAEVPYAVPASAVPASAATPMQAASPPPSDGDPMWENYWRQSTGTPGNAPVVVATSSFPVLTSTTDALPLSTPMTTAPAVRPRDNSRWLAIILMGAAALGVGLVAGRMFVAPRPAFSPVAYLKASLQPPPPDDLTQRRRSIPKTPSPTQQRRRERRVFWKGYSSRPDQTAGSPPPHSDALRTWKATHR